MARNFFALALVVWMCSTVQAVEFQDFADDPTSDGWVGFQNNVAGNNYGWSAATNQTSNDASPGEAGGLVVRGNGNSNNYYGDITLGTTYTLNDALSASGWFRFEIPIDTGVPDPKLAFGFFNKDTAPADVDVNAIGFTLADSSGTGMRIGAYVLDSVGPSAFDLANPQGAFPHQTNYFFNINYDPNAGAFGVLTVTIDSDASSGNGVLGTGVVSLTSGQRTVGALLNSFGLVNFEDGNNPSQFIYFDDVTYTSVQAVPEPTSLFLIGFGSLALIAANRSRSRSR